MVEQVKEIDPERVRANLSEIRERISAADPSGQGGAGIEVVAATKYVPVELMGTLAEGGVTVAGENRIQDLTAKQERWGDLFTWDFIGDLQSRKAPSLVGKVRLIQSLATESALLKLERAEAVQQKVLVQVNLAQEESKSGIAVEDLARYLDSEGCDVVGLMTMPPFTADAEESRPWFAKLRDLADKNGLEIVSMGTSQDYEVAVSEGATHVRIGASLCR
ncbi:MAG: YggS family pyridoxal phosphate enzyme [Actinomycetes bacterium]